MNIFSNISIKKLMQIFNDVVKNKADKNHTHDVFVKSGSGARSGFVPSPGTTTGTTKYLREDGTWQTPPDTNTTYNDVTTSAHGLMTASDKTKLNGIATGATKNSASTTTPKANGTAAVGTESGYSRGDHVHPLQTSVSGNAGTATKLATARTIDGVDFDGSSAISHYGTCSTAAGTAAKVVALTGFKLSTGATVRVKFTVTNTAANPTLNVNNTGDKAIYYRGAVISSGYLATNRTYEFCYNGTQWELVGDVNTNTTYSNFVKSGTGAKAGLVPAPSTTAGTSKYLREDGTWTTPPNTVYSHPTTSGNKHIPSGGSSGQILRWSADGTATWGSDTSVEAATELPKSIAMSGTVGTSTKYAREDHVHSLPPGGKAEQTLCKFSDTSFVWRDNIGRTSLSTVEWLPGITNNFLTVGEIFNDYDVYDPDISTIHHTFGNAAGGSRSHTEGSGNLCASKCAHAEGSYNRAHGEASHVEGYGCMAMGRASHAEGYSTKALSANYFMKVKSVNSSTKTLTIDTTSQSWTTNYTSGGIKCLSVGCYIGIYGSTLKGAKVTAVDTTNGTVTIDSAISSATYIYRMDISDGESTYPGGHNHAEGSGSIAVGVGTHAEGKSMALAQYAHSEGSGTASGFYSHAEGYNTQSSAQYSHAGGYISSSSSECSFSHGNNCSASHKCATSIGSNCKASGESSAAFNHYTQATQGSAFACGNNTISQGTASFSAGYYTTASAYAQAVFGKYNKSSTAEADIFIVGSGTTTSAKANCFRINTTNGCFGLKAFNATGADYAEMFEWEDGNLDNEDRRGRFVTLNGDKIKLANSSDEFILGIVSGDPSVVGDVYDDQWNGMYLTDIYGKFIMEEVEISEQYEMREDPQDSNVLHKVVLQPAHTETRKKLNPDYDPNQTYIPRSERPEWDAVGMMGKLIVVDDGSCEVNKYCLPSVDGIATDSYKYFAEKTNYRVIKRIDENHVQVLVL